MLTETNFNQEVAVPKGTLVQVVLENESLGPWTIPQSSDSVAMPRLSASSRCVTPVIARFRTHGPATIRALRDNGEMSQEYKVSIKIGD